MKAQDRGMPQQGIALLAVLMALTLLLLLALPFSVSMSRGADAAARAVEQRRAEWLSASVRDLMLAEAAFGHPSYDETPDADARDEFPPAPTAALPDLAMEGRARHGGEIFDVQRKIALDAATPLLFANLIGTTARLAAELLPDAEEVLLDAGGNLPQSGFVWVDHEVIRYGDRQGNKLVDVERGVFAEMGFLRPQDHQVAESALVLDWRCVLAASFPIDFRTGGRRDQRRPFLAPAELAEIEQAGVGGFTSRELDVFAASLVGAADIPNAPVWGRPERVFAGCAAGSRRLVVKSALHLGAGSLVRIRSLASPLVEHGIVMSALTPRGPQQLQLPSIYELSLLLPLAQDFPELDTVVEPLVPAPVNVNTAEPAVLAALFAGCRRGIDVRVHDASGSRRVSPMPPMSPGEAREIADQICSLREDLPFAGFEDLAQRVFRARLLEGSQDQKLRLLQLYRLMLTGRDSVVEMATAPVCFASGPLVGYRAASALQRSAAAPAIAARHERTGLALAMPGLPLISNWRTQERIEDAFRLDQRAPYWLTGPINVGAVGGGELGNDPTSRYVAHLVAIAFPDAGLGQTRYPSRDEAQAYVQPGAASVRPGEWPRGGAVSQAARYGHDAFSTAVDPRGHSVSADGPFRIRNTGPRDASGGATTANTHQLTHAFTNAIGKGGAGRFAVSAWYEPQALTDCTLLDYFDPQSGQDRNRMRLFVQGDRLVYEASDEAGVDPDPSLSPAGVARSAVRWELPLAELALPANHPVHVAASTYACRPSDLSVAVDGVARGRTLFRTKLTANVPYFDPSQIPPGPPGQASTDPRTIVLQVEDSAGFPTQGVLRVGTELFEYTEIQGNSFVCRYRDSTGGRGARQIAREHRPSVPTDAQGRPTIDINSLTGGANIDQFPEHLAGSEVELYGYSALPSSDTLLFPGSSPVPAIGGFAVARGWLNNGRPIVLSAQGVPPRQIGTGIDETWTGDLELADPVPTGTRPPAQASAAIADAFPTEGGFALLVQQGRRFTPPLGQVAAEVLVGGVEVIRYQRRAGSKLMGVQRAVVLPGDDSQINNRWFDRTPHKFVVDWDDSFVDPRSQPPRSWDEDPLRILNVVPISLPLQSAGGLPDPQQTGTSEWVQLYPSSAPQDTEWVRYDTIVEGRHLVRGFRGAWEAVRFVLTNQVAIEEVQVGPLGPVGGVAVGNAAPWPAVSPTSGYIGYIPQVESNFPQIHQARNVLGFRGDPFTGTSSHSQQNSVAVPCHRLDLNWGNFGAMTGRPGRHDRVALVAGSAASGSQRPGVEWHTVNWSCRRYTGDLQFQTPPAERLGPDPFQLAAFQDGVSLLIRGQQRGQQVFDMRTVDRIVKFPSGELPAAAADAVAMGGTGQGAETMAGFVDEISVADQAAVDLIVDEAFADTEQQFTVLTTALAAPQGLLYLGADLTSDFPSGGGLVQIDGEILAYQSHANGSFQIARNGRGLLGTEPQAQDRGARVHFLTHRPCGIAAGSVSSRSDSIPLVQRGAMPSQFGTVLLGRSEYAHYAWTRTNGDQVSLEMPRQYPPGEEGNSGVARGLLRGRYGTAPVTVSAGEPVVLMPFRYWDRNAERCDDPEQAYFQFTMRQGPVFFRSLRWEEETLNALVDVRCLVRADQRAPWTAEPGQTPFLRVLDRSAGDSEAQPLLFQATQLEVRFVHVYRPGCLDPFTMRAHAWKTAPRVQGVEVEYEGEGRILREEVAIR